MQTLFGGGAGGALGAICRYLFSLIPFPGPFPVATLLINLFGAAIADAQKDEDEQGDGAKTTHTNETTTTPSAR